MGLETTAELVHEGQTVCVKALLESRELILRAPVKRTLAIADIANARVVDNALLFEHAGETFALTLPAGQALKWLKKITTPPPTLAHKLGIDAARPALVHGEVTDAVLAEALAGASTSDARHAAVGIAVVATPDDLTTATGVLIEAVPGKPLWIVFPKGAGSSLPESIVRTRMRGMGFIDTKACSVSQTLTASRFSPKA